MKVTLVERQKKNSKRFNIYLDGKFAFGADEDTLVTFRLIEGKEFTQEVLEKILLETEMGKLIDRVYRLLSRRGRSEREVRDYFKTLSFKRKIKDKEEISEIVIESLIEKLKLRDLINDKRFASDWVESRGKKRGTQILKGELIQKGIDREIIEEVISYQSSAVSQEEIAEQALEKKMKSFSSLDEIKFKRKATEFLMRRGFSYDLAKGAVEKKLKKE